MINLQKISRCLISVSDKTGVVELARFLSENGVEIISTPFSDKNLANSTTPDLSETEIKQREIFCKLFI